MRLKCFPIACRDFWRDLKELWDKMWSLWRKRPTRAQCPCIEHIKVIQNFAEGLVVIRTTFESGRILDLVMWPAHALDLARELQNAARLLNTLECPGN